MLTCTILATHKPTYLCFYMDKLRLTAHWTTTSSNHMNAEIGQCSFYCSPKIWNEISATMKASATVATFKHQPKSYFLSQLATH